MGQVELGRLFGVPIVLDVTFILLIVLYGFTHFTSANIASISYGIVLVAGVALSILLHEFGHSFAARYYGVPTAYIELNGLGGLCHFARPMPLKRSANIVMLLAGPAANFVLWHLFSQTGAWLLNNHQVSGLAIAAPGRTGYLLLQLGQVNQLLFWFNLLPAHPLDGGRALAQLLSAPFGYDRSMRWVAYGGLIITALLGMAALGGAPYALLVALVLFQANMQVLQTHRGPPWTRQGG